MNQETKIQRAIMLALSEAGCTVFRCETGNFWTGRVIHQAGNQVTLANAMMLPCGLTKGGSDLIGWTADGRFLAVEVKTAKGRPTKEQIRFIDAVNRDGGVAGICRSPQDALDLIGHNED